MTIAQATQPAVAAIFETGAWLDGQGVANVSPMNKGGAETLSGITISMTHAIHSCGIRDTDGKIIYGGEACGYVLELENGFKIYHAGDTALFGDMKLIAQLYKPDLAMLPIGDRFTMDPRAAAVAVKLLKPKYVIPMHHSTFPLLTGTPEAFRKALRGIEGVKLLTLAPGETAA